MDRVVLPFVSPASPVYGFLDRALAVIEPNVAKESDAERLLEEVRVFLAMAHQYEAGREIEMADACGAMAANKLARAIRASGQ